MARSARILPFLALLVAGCGGAAPAAPPVSSAPASASATASPAVAPAQNVTSPSDDTKPDHPRHPDLLGYAKAHLPPGGEAAMDGGHLVLTHRYAAGDSAGKIAAAWLDLTDIYAKDDLARAIARANPKLGAHQLAPGDRVTIPSPIAEAPASADDERIGWPDDHSIRGIYMHDDGYYGGVNWVPTLERMKARGMNAIVLDFKDYDGRFTYDTKLPLAKETHASIHHIPDMARAIRFAHRHGIRILARIACFHDPWTAPKKTELSIMGNWAAPSPAAGSIRGTKKHIRTSRTSSARRSPSASTRCSSITCATRCTRR